jgi:hypothetical protein
MAVRDYGLPRHTGQRCGKELLWSEQAVDDWAAARTTPGRKRMQHRGTEPTSQQPETTA